jgi:hypothetical protein
MDVLTPKFLFEMARIDAPKKNEDAMDLEKATLALITFK